eukprot:TRINITY_DN17555_c0_g1_i1.p1 TRINITY_DN17555_c0_g1~~TRINITY_DN17555_c0_g1_i1.p1  ORF type:complete len:398 (+),score=61.26 TRINITY_DN17555_c0_g1_i1:114-1196(+)
MRQKTSGSVICHKLLASPLNLPVSAMRMRIPVPNSLEGIGPEMLQEHMTKSTVNFLEQNLDIIIEKLARRSALNGHESQPSSEPAPLADGDSKPRVLFVVPACDQMIYLQERQKKKLLAKKPGLWGCLEFLATDDLDDLRDELADNFPTILHIEGMPKWRRPGSRDLVLPNEISQVLLPQVRVVVPESLEEVDRAIVINAGATSLDAAHKWFTDDHLTDLNSRLQFIGCHSSLDTRVHEDFTRLFYDCLMNNDALDSTCIRTAFELAKGPVEEYFTLPQMQETGSVPEDALSSGPYLEVSVECSAKELGESPEANQRILEAPLRASSQMGGHEHVPAVEMSPHNQSSSGVQGNFIVSGGG